ncbi:lipid II:glycine glycyltransferase FemX [Breznakiella homolactica]|uniref:Peptidoglycan bridge formation glycyltransferase FemA/FemB family protein n=1 Tax=Breznakiella homolactica TaxID=2798577 RepID=A0A7T7XLA5_9SPIR|nr:peptidoglycan bridge formation glycyltransferase FemA/FemB family protein [Breznakiella homolactica]QQO08461.1 peptidoglycan bridge formation glycyltransferase FemA/FemB family protein [Breznakiella homolactica]
MSVKIDILQKSSGKLYESRLLQQTSYWSSVKGGLGWEPLAFDIQFGNRTIGDVLILKKNLGEGRFMAYAPYGPETIPEETSEGVYLAELSEQLYPYLGNSCIFMRWDIPWESPYADDPGRYNEKNEWLGPPETRLQELRMNWGVERTGLRKASSNYLPNDTIILDIRDEQESLLEKMHPKTRYNIRLAERHQVTVREGTCRDIGIWNTLYSVTAARNSIQNHGSDYFFQLFKSRSTGKSIGIESGSVPDTSISLLIAEADETPLAAMFMATSSDRATYLYGASSDDRRNYMAPYALQWYAIQKAKDVSCTSYDFFGVAPAPEPEHPMHGLYRFKKGFGGRMLHRQGAWDYPYDEKLYMQYQCKEAASPGFNV